MLTKPFLDKQFDALETLPISIWSRLNKNNAIANKQKLFAMAKAGKARPSQKNTLGMRLSRYTNKSSSSYDPVFDKKIRKLITDWFVTSSDKTAINKKKLLKLAKSGEARPARKTSLGESLHRYATKSNGCYDPVFGKKIRKLRTDWFIKSSDKATIKKQQIIDMAKKSGPRPNSRTSGLGRSLINYTNKSSDCYDPVFDKEIRELRPDWFRRKAA